MGLIDFIRNRLNAAVGRNQQFSELVEAGDISRALNLMDCHEEEVLKAISNYEPELHKIMGRLDKVVKDKDGNIKDIVHRWKLPLNYPQYINEIALVFLYGRPVKWSLKTPETQAAFDYYTDLLDRIHFNTKLREMKRFAGAETQSAMLFRVFRNSEGKADVQIRVLARSKGDKIYTYFDVYENLLAAAWGFYAKDANSETREHVEVYTRQNIYHCVKAALGWTVTSETNIIGKIPLIFDRQLTECHGVEPLIGREEYLGSHTADNNDYFSDPYLAVNADIIKNMPKKGEDGKILVTRGNVDDVSKAARYITWDGAPESKKQEIEWLQKHILTKSFTPDIESLQSLANVSYKTAKYTLMPAYIKADKNKEVQDELLTRTSNLIKAIIGNVLNVGLKSECEKMNIAHEFQEPFAEDIQEVMENIDTAIDGGWMSNESAIEKNPLVDDHELEKERIKKEKEEGAAIQRNIFRQSEDTEDDVNGGAE